MNQEEFAAARIKVMEKRMEKNRLYLYKETGMDAAERFYMCLLQNKEIQELPEHYQYLLAIEDLIGKIEKDGEGRSYLPEEEIIKYYPTPYFQKVAVRMDVVLSKRNEVHGK
jgi:hypothetical protein